MLIALILLMALIGFPVVVAAQWGGVHVDGYTRRDGTYVAPHYRSTPDSSTNNNWSTSPNVNPYTGRQGTNQPRNYDAPNNSDVWRTPPSGFQPRYRSR